MSDFRGIGGVWVRQIARTHVCSRAETGRHLTDASRPLSADTVEKVENRATPEISQMLIFGQLYRWDAP